MVRLTNTCALVRSGEQLPLISAMALESRIAVSRLMSRGAEQSKTGSHAVWVAVSADEATLAPCFPARQGLAASADQEEAVSVADSKEVSTAVVEEGVSEVASAAVVVVAVSVAAATLAAEAATAAEIATATVRQVVHQEVLAATTVEMATVLPLVGMILAEAGAPTTPTGTAAVVVAVVVVTVMAADLVAVASAIATLADRPVATWNRLVAERVGIVNATETTTDLATTTTGSAVTKVVATKIPASFAATEPRLVSSSPPSCLLCIQSVPRSIRVPRR